MTRFMQEMAEGFASIGRQKWAQATAVTVLTVPVALLAAWMLLNPLGWFMLTAILLIVATDPGFEEGGGG